MTLPQIACIGAGIIGRSWAAVFARAEIAVRLCDQDENALEEARKFINDTGRLYASVGLIDEASRLASRVEYTSDLAHALSGSTYVQENIAENIDVKRQLFQQMGALTLPDTVLASSTSSISGSEFMGPQELGRRCLVAHPLNPPHLVPLVELCPTRWTEPRFTENARELLLRAGQTPIVLQKEVDGFVANRLQVALLREAFHLIGEGVCSARAIDQVLLDGLALRWAINGPIEAASFNSVGGFSIYMHKYREALDRITAKIDVRYPVSDELIERVDAMLQQDFGATPISRRIEMRDRSMLALRRHLQDSRADAQRVITPPLERSGDR